MGRACCLVMWLLLAVPLGCSGLSTASGTNAPLAPATPTQEASPILISPPPTPTPTATPRPSLTPTPSQTPTPTPTPTATATPTPTLTPTPVPPSPASPPRATVLLEPMNYQRQAVNNCGPASIAILLGYYGHWVTQYKVNERVPAGSLTPCDVVLYVFDYGLMARLYFSTPTSEPIRQLLDIGVPVIYNQWLSLDSGYRHYRVVRGYDAESQEFITADPILGAYYRIPYDVFEALSQPGNLIPVYPPELDPQVQAILGAQGAAEISCP